MAKRTSSVNHPIADASRYLSQAAVKLSDTAALAHVVDMLRADGALQTSKTRAAAEADLQRQLAAVRTLMDAADVRIVGYLPEPPAALTPVAERMKKCGRCGGLTPVGQSCGCFDNGSQ